MIKAIYRAREDGDYDFLAAFSEDYDYDFGRTVEQIAELLVEDGEEIIVKNFKDLEHLTDVIEGWEAKFEKKLARVEKDVFRPTGCDYGIGG